MKAKLHPRAQARILERGATEREVIATVEHGEQFSAKFGRKGFRRNSLMRANGEVDTAPISRLKSSLCRMMMFGWSSR